ncbi:kinase-like protein [Gymnopus androsaceus JB14]|uniref:Kinase-like protein n=1 Tax=Gymnopus androsaceus JB14 TaxID=1447944 RepID=A0A6A4IBC8_9AGAR|nr:kinase-like protein [Gymnopus androsaceus JB14]
MTQIINAVAYLHVHQIAHRDLKPANVLLTSTGRVVVIDFGIAWNGSDEEDAKKSDLWPEQKDKMYFEVSTGPYRAPELLFGTRSYNAYAIDLWSLGTLFAEFFTELAPVSSSDYEYAPPNTRYCRTSLFDASRGEIGLVWSIFKILGTPREPNDETEDKKSWAWPGFKDLPDAQKVEFTKVDGVELDERIFPNLPKGKWDDSSPVDLIRRLVQYPPERRIQATEALEHAFLSPAGLYGEVLIPEDLQAGISASGSNGIGKVLIVELNGARRTLGDMLLETLSSSCV